MSRARSLYLHFPFCETKCHYCDFYSLPQQSVAPERRARVIQAMRREMEWSKDELNPSLETVFMGGGTPSMTAAADIGHVLEPILDRVDSETEWTMEANPSSIQKATLPEYRALGVNRLSIGIQSLNDARLEWLGRAHDSAQALGALDLVFSSGFENVSVDLLCGVPGQTTADLEQELERLSRFPITHLSCYLLTLPKTHRHFADLPKEDQQLEHLLLIDDFLRGRGFEHYEVSNFARPGRRARHNLVYWKGAPYLGIGPSAHSYSDANHTRWKNVSSIETYVEKIESGKKPLDWAENLTAEQRHLEKWLLAIRLNDGFPSSWLTSETQQQRHQTLLEQGLLEHHPEQMGIVRLTPRGFALSDQIVAALS